MPKRKRGGRKASNANQTDVPIQKSQEPKREKSDEEPWSKSKKKRMRRKMAIMNRNINNNNAASSSETFESDKVEQKTMSDQIDITKKDESSESNSISMIETKLSGKRPMSALQQKFLSRLAGSRFRELNEELYTTNSALAYKRFQANPELFEQYHEGFRTQVKSWPVNPIDVIHKWIISYYQKSKKEMEEKNRQQLRIADFGCGDAKLAEKLVAFRSKSNTKKGKGQTCPFKVHSFDLVSNGNKLITPCDMSNVPLKNGSVDVGVFVLALMGTNIADFIREAHRVLTPDGLLKIAEVRSRFESTNEDREDDDSSNITEGRHGHKGRKSQSKENYTYSKKQRDETLLNDFLDVMEQLGFQCMKKDRQNKMFLILEFKKTGKLPSKKASFTAKPCIYKRR